MRADGLDGYHNDRLHHEGHLDRDIRQRAVQEIKGVV